MIYTGPRLLERTSRSLSSRPELIKRILESRRSSFLAPRLTLDRIQMNTHSLASARSLHPSRYHPASSNVSHVSGLLFPSCQIVSFYLGRLVMLKILFVTASIPKSLTTAG